MQDRLTLVDWRLRVAHLFDRVRAADDPAEGHQLWREGRAELFATHPQSPTGAWEDRAAVEYWPYDPTLRFEVPLLEAQPDVREAPAGEDGTVTLTRVAMVELPDLGTLDVWWLDQYAGGIFVPLRDGTSGTPGDDGAQSYGGGRYLLDTAKGAWHGGDDRHLVLDLNFAYHPSCRYDARWQCPLAPPGNTLEARIEAGERL